MDIACDNGGGQYQYGNLVANSPIQVMHRHFDLKCSANLTHNFSNQCLLMHSGMIVKLNKVQSP